MHLDAAQAALPECTMGCPGTIVACTAWLRILVYACTELRRPQDTVRSVAECVLLQGKTLTNDQIFNAVDCAIQNKQVPYATNAVYLLLGASNVKASSGAWCCTTIPERTSRSSLCSLGMLASEPAAQNQLFWSQIQEPSCC